MAINIGVFDSGVGGLWILKHLVDKLPQLHYVFVGDQGHVPYGSRKMEEIRDFSEEITKFLIDKNCKIIVVACNTASAASLSYLRLKFPDIIFVGMEPAIKPAIENTHTKKVGVLATPATFQGELYNSLVEKFAHDVTIFKNTCPGLVEQVEKGEFSSEKTISILNEALLPMLREGIDTVVLGCTHYPFVISQIENIVGEKVKVIDPTDAIVRRVESFLAKDSISDNLVSDIEIFTSGDSKNMQIILSNLFGSQIKAKEIKWMDDLKIMI